MERCLQCTLALRQCARCRGVMGPFNRYCGFCGFEVTRPRRNPLLWSALLIALFLVAAGLAFGALAISHSRAAPTHRAAVQNTVHTSGASALSFEAPISWTVTSRADTVVAARNGGDLSSSSGDPLQVTPRGPLAAISRPPAAAGSAVSSSDPAAVLSAEVSNLTGSPPSGVKVDVLEPVHSTTVDGRPAAAALLRLTRDAAIYQFERTLVYAPHGSLPAMIQVDATAPEAAWTGGDGTTLEALAASIKPS